jgi:glycosyltransferase involved in cell wall biosynthesis
MTIHFAEPPAAKRVGGLDAAIRALENALRSRGMDVKSGSAHQAQDGDIVHFHGLWQFDHAKLSGDLAKRGVTMVVSPHGMLEPWAWRHRWWKKWPYYGLIERKHLGRAKALLATAAPEAQRLRQMLPGQRIDALPLGLTDNSAAPDFTRAREALGWEPDETVFLFLSRLHPKKGLDLLLRALALVELPPKSRLVVVGNGDLKYVASLRALADSLSSQLPRVDWTGEVWGAARWPYFQGANLFCLPTHSENFGLAVLEACQVGTPVLTSTTTPWAQWLGAGRGFIAKPTVDSIAKQLRTYLEHPVDSSYRRADLAQWTHDQFSWDALTPRFEEFYHSLLFV